MATRSNVSPLPLNPRVLLKLLVQPSNSTRNQNSEAGLTLIECLVAMVVITLTVVTITPPIFLATASRIQARRAEQANQIAQGEIDRVRSILERPSYRTNDLPSPTALTPAQFRTGLPPTAVDTGSLLSPATCGSYPRFQDIADPANPTVTIREGIPVAATALIPVDVDGDCQPEYAMQVFRDNGCIPAALATQTPPPAPSSFTTGVRVYAYVPGQGGSYQAERGTLGLTTGRKDQDGAGLRKPLQTLYTKVVRGGSSRALECAGG